MKQTNTFFRQTLDQRQLTILVELCVAIFREMLPSSGVNNVTNHEVAGNIQARAALEDRYPDDRNTTTMMGHNDGAEPSDMNGLQYPEQQDPGQTPSIVPQLLLTVEQAAHRLGIGRSLMYELVSGGKVASITIGRVRRIPMIELEAFVQRRLAESA